MNARGTAATVGSHSQSHRSSGTAGSAVPAEEWETEAAPPPTPREPSAHSRPITLGDLKAGKVVVAVIAAVAIPIGSGIWWLSGSASKVEQHTEFIKELRGKVDTLTSESASAGARLTSIEGRTTKLEDKVSEQARAGNHP